LAADAVAETRETEPTTNNPSELDLSECKPGVLAGVEVSDKPDLELTDQEWNAVKDLCAQAAKRDYPARLVEVIQAWEKLDIETPIATPNGWMRVGDLLAGDYVFGSNGRIIDVLAVQPISKEFSYSIKFDDGSCIVASEGHTWNTQTVKERYAGLPAKERSTKELFDTQDKSHSIDLSPGLQTMCMELPIDPYLLGCWLGDGSARGSELTGNAEDLGELIGNFEAAGYQASKPSKSGGRNALIKNCWKTWIHKLSGTLRHLGILDNKRIPKIYLRASISQRIALLQGLMDTDGWADGSGACGWGQSSDKHFGLIEDFSELLASLGVKHQFYPYSRERDGKVYNFQQTSFRPQFAAFRLKRKLAKQKIPKENGRTRKVYIQKIEPVGERLVRCISVNAPDHLYLAGKSMVPTHNCRLFYRGFQFLIPLRGGGWEVPGESTGFGPSMQLDLALLPTNIYSTYAQILIATLTRAVPTVRFQPQDPSNDVQITAADSADKFLKVIERNNDLIVIQTDACRYLYTDGRALYYTRFVRDGQRFGWEEKDEAEDVVPETEPSEEEAEAEIEAEEEKAAEASEGLPPEVREVIEAGGEAGGEEEEEELPTPLTERIPRGQEVRTAHGKLEVKMVPMQANNLAECDCIQFEEEVDTSRAKGMFPKVADKIRPGSRGITEGEIARLARINTKLGMQSTYVTSDSIARDTTIQRTWFRPSFLTHIQNKTVRDALLTKCPDGLAVCYAGDTACYARNAAIEENWALMQAYSGDGQNRNAMGTSLMPIQKRLNNWLDLMNDLFIRCIPKKWMHNKAFNVEAIRGQTNIPGDVGAFMPIEGLAAGDLVFVEPTINVPQSLPDFIRQYAGELAELLTGAYPALAGSDQDNNPTATGKVIQRDQALGRIAPTWHQIQNAEADASLQGVRWASRCRDGSINEYVPGSEPIRLEVNNLRGNIMCYPESDESFPETHPQKQNRLMQFLGDTAKNPMLAEVLYNPSNVNFLLEMTALTDLYIPQVASYEKQLGEFELLLHQKPLPNPKIKDAQQLILKLSGDPLVNPQALLAARQEIEQMQQAAPLVSSVPVDAQLDDSETEAFACWKFLNSPEGRKMKRTQPDAYDNVRLHWLEHDQIAQQKKAGAQNVKPPSESIAYKDLETSNAKVQLLAKGGISETPAAIDKAVGPPVLSGPVQ
jgi:LAGLIDADG-like domain